MQWGDFQMVNSAPLETTGGVAPLRLQIPIDFSLHAVGFKG